MTGEAPGRVPHSRPSVSEADAAAVARVVSSGRLAQGEQVARFESAVAARLGLAGGVAVGSGTMALHLALRAIGIGPGDEVLVPSLACAAVLQAVRHAGASPRPVDCDASTGNLDPDAARRQVGRATRAAVVVHHLGMPAPVEPISALGLPVIEDCAHALGATVGGRSVGRAGVAAVVSFYATKLVTTGEGGMVLSDDPGILARVRELRSCDEADDGRLRFNAKMTDLQAALGLSQLARLDAFLARRRELAARYARALADADVGLPPGVPGAVEEAPGRVFFRFVVDVPGGAAAALRALADAGVDARRPVYRPLHWDLGLAAEAFPGAEASWARSVSVPLYPDLGESEVDRVIAAARAAFPARPVRRSRAGGTVLS